MVEDAFPLSIAQLVADHHQAVYRYAYRLTGSVHDAEDLTQQVFLTAHEKLRQVREVSSIRSWLFAILRNNFLKACQKRKPILAESVELNLNSVPEEAPKGADIDEERLQKALGELPDVYRLVLVMFYFEGLSYREIAQRLDTPMGTVMSRLARAKGHLRERLFVARDSMTVETEPGTVG